MGVRERPIMSEDADVDYMMVLQGEVRELRAKGERLRADNLRLKAVLARIATANPFVPKSELCADAKAALRSNRQKGRK
jgi:hypothetical protein